MVNKLVAKAFGTPARSITKCDWFVIGKFLKSLRFVQCSTKSIAILAQDPWLC